MKVKKELWLMLGIYAFLIWIVVISICVADLYAMQEILEDFVYSLESRVRDLYEFINSAEGMWM